MTPKDAFIQLWKLIEQAGLDLPTEEDMKSLLCVLGEAAQLPNQLVSGSAVSEGEAEGRNLAEESKEEKL